MGYRMLAHSAMFKNSRPLAIPPGVCKCGSRKEEHVEPGDPRLGTDWLAWQTECKRFITRGSMDKPGLILAGFNPQERDLAGIGRRILALMEESEEPMTRVQIRAAFKPHERRGVSSTYRAITALVKGGHLHCERRHKATSLYRLKR